MENPTEELNAQEQEALKQMGQEVQEVQEVQSATCTPGKLYALIENNSITDIFDGSVLPTYNPTMIKLIEIPKDQAHLYAVGGRIKDGQLVPMSLEEAKNRKKAWINSMFENAVLDLHNEHVPFVEVLSYERQLQDSITCFKEPNGPTPFLDGLAKARGEDRRLLAKKILDKSEAYTKGLTKLLGQRHQAILNVEGAQSVLEVYQIEYNPKI
ncbi:hypothetical protein NHP190002_05430 [Helicobacter ailurogastricus]|uniref:hypothetical protein n=1 Tax=Helicobacter ailurogastricus TaxID=1578720 RepID=UPI00244D94B6|nr:hypothetical protein [Helicobacter ailurogastricus]GMB89864.1 hypothetical protein NHP190002_05430 [Helicobacter ailurogastricus]